jgi:hypothetical protein
MRRWIGWAAYLYPPAWRARYGAEFDALLDDANVRWRDLADVLRGALIMQMTHWKSYAKVVVAAGIACAIVSESQPLRVEGGNADRPAIPARRFNSGGV